MELYKNIPFSCDGREYEIRIYYEPGRINVMAFEANRPADGYRYQVMLPRDISPTQLLEKSAVPELVGMCKDNLEANRWSLYRDEFALITDPST